VSSIQSEIFSSMLVHRRAGMATAHKDSFEG
jgi:hypothetical protein